MKTKEIYIKEKIGKGYNAYWNFKGRYRVVKGSRASKKSKTTALWYIVNMAKYPGANTLVVRKTFRTIKDSCFTELKWAIATLGIEQFWHIKESPLEMTYLPTGQKIYFRGLDDPLKITSITVDVGALCWLWVEEAYEIMNESDFDMLNESIRGRVPQGLFKQTTLTFNPWNDRHWIKSRFFDKPSSDVFTLTTNYRINEWLDNADLELFEDMKKRNPRRYQVAGLGNWGVVEGLIYENYEEKEFKLEDLIGHTEFVYGLDFGYTNDPTALFCGAVDSHNMVLYVFDELYKTNLTNKKIYNELRSMGYDKKRIIADSAEPKSIDELKECGAWDIEKSRKGKDSVNSGIQHIQNYKIIVHPRCVNFLTEISNYTWDTNKTGKKLNTPTDNMNHLMDAMRYAMEKYSLGKRFDFF